jgi:hypothetical protein
MTQNLSAPTLACFRRKPDNWLEFPPLASSLQTIETALMLLMMGRYPAALIDCASATESVLKAKYKIRRDDTTNFADLVVQACIESPDLSFRKNAFDKLRQARNKMIHYGYSPRDDAESARLLLGVGFDFLAICYKKFFNFDLMDSLVVEISKNLSVSFETFNITKRMQINPAYCFIPLVSTLRQYFQPTFKPDWEYDALEHCDNVGIEFENVSDRTKEIESIFKNSWKFWCPICGGNSLIAEIDASAFNLKEVKLNRVVCCKCDLVIPNGCPELANVLLKSEVGTEREKIFKDYGLV